jgi:hypothetical protein
MIQPFWQLKVIWCWKQSDCIAIVSLKEFDKYNDGA